MRWKRTLLDFQVVAQEAMAEEDEIAIVAAA